MNLQALYDLKERLEYATIAGTALMQEDFRLHRAVEALTPLATVNPVFGKISTSAKALLSAPQEERSCRLLDVLSLVDAVVYTQGVSNISGEMVPVQPGMGTYAEVSYGELQPLLTALSGSGSGRTSYIQKCYAQHPEYFSDFRVLPHVVKALGDNYGELADFIAMILRKQGTSIIPLLKEGFDPAGKMEMTRRVRLIANLAGGGENDWFVSILPECRKDVREAVIQALSLSPDNGQLLLELCQSERGKLREAALRSLAMMKDQICIDFLRKEIQKKPDHVGFLTGVGSVIAADFAADALQKMLEILLKDNKVYDQTELESLIKLTAAAAGKYSPRMAELWRWIAERMEQFAQIVPEKNVRNCDFSVAEHLQKTLMQSILWNSGYEMLELARSLAAENREWFLCCGFLADMAELSPERLYEKYAPMIQRNGIVKRESRSERNDRIQIMRGLSAIRWDAQLHSYYVSFTRFDALTGNATNAVRKLDGVDPGWMRLLTDPKVNEDGAVYDLSLSDQYRKVEPAFDWVISWMIDGDNPEVCNLAGSWLYRWTKVTGKFNYHFSDLLICGWKNWKGLLSHCVAKQGEVSYYSIMEWIQRLPVSDLEKAEELRSLDLLVKRKEVKVQHGHWPDTLVSRQIAVLEADPNGTI
ncbi:MAG: HEAT repeat domain-containing protein [Oscillospiraceae bacterium]|nr:HEAT repeat domain-containing protein [Oscillospiraceae bacterium]